MKTFNRFISVLSKTVGISLISTGVIGGVFILDQSTGKPLLFNWLYIIAMGVGFVLLSVVADLPVNQIDWSDKRQK